MGSNSETSETEEEAPEMIIKLRKSAKRRFTQLVTKIRSQVDSQCDSSTLQVHRANLVESYDECLRLQTRYVEKAAPMGEALRTTERWSQDLDQAYMHTAELADRYLSDLDQQEETPEEPQSVHVLERELQHSTRKLAEELEDSRLEEARKAEDIRRKAAREQRELEHRIAIARAGTSKGPGPLSSTTIEVEAIMNDTRKRSYTTVARDWEKKSTNQEVDAWIYQPFQNNVNGEGQTMVSLSMIPNLRWFSGDPREWPMFIQTFKTIVHDVFNSDAQRLAMLHTMLGDKLRAGMSQILSAPAAYRQALQELRRKYGHPHLVVRTYIQGLMELAPYKGGFFY